MFHRKSFSCIILFLFFWSNCTFAGGYQVNLQGVKQTGMGHCGVSLYQGPSNLFFNPGSIGQGSEKIAFAAGISLIDARLIHYNPTVNKSFRNNRKLGTPIGIYYTHKINKNFTAGLAVFTPFGSSLEYEEGWAGRYVLTDISLGTIYAQPTIAFQKGPVGIGVGIMLGSGWLNFAQDIPITDSQGNVANVRLDAKANSYAFNLGLSINITEGLDFGASYRTSHRYKVTDGKADFTVPSSAQEQLKDQEFSSELWAPANAMFGLTLTPTKRLVISGEVNFTFWSVYRDLKIDFKENSDALADVDEPRRWRDSETFRFGVQYQLSNSVVVRAGYSKDNTPVNRDYYGPETPDSDRRGYHVGTSVKIRKGLKLDLAFQLAEAEQIEARHKPSGFSGVYKGRAFVYAGGLSYAF